LTFLEEVNLPRPPKCRRVEQIPEFNYFKPAGIPLVKLEENVLTVEEVEAIRLKDMEGLEQEECASRMHVSRPTFHRILVSARKKIAESLIEGKAIRIAGGNFQLVSRKLQCEACGHQWEVPFGNGRSARESSCPACHHKTSFRI